MAVSVESHPKVVSSTLPPERKKHPDGYFRTKARGVRWNVYRVKSSPYGRMFARHAINGRLLSGVHFYDKGGVVTAEETVR